MPPKCPGVRTSATQASYIAPYIDLSGVLSPYASSYCQKQVPVVVLFGKKYSHFNMEDSMLDVQFIKTVQRIEEVYKDIFPARPDRVRVQEWVVRLADNWCCDKLPLLKNRNRYIKLLLSCMTDIGKLAGVFKKRPPLVGQELATLQKH
jgi:hypothetical protein